MPPPGAALGPLTGRRTLKRRRPHLRASSAQDQAAHKGHLPAACADCRRQGTLQALQGSLRLVQPLSTAAAGMSMPARQVIWRAACAVSPRSAVHKALEPLLQWQQLDLAVLQVNVLIWAAPSHKRGCRGSPPSCHPGRLLSSPSQGRLLAKPVSRHQQGLSVHRTPPYAAQAAPRAPAMHSQRPA